MPLTVETARAYDILAEREQHRRLLSILPPQRHPAPEQVFYTVANSKQHRSSNRYSDVLAYDRTSVQVGKSGYINANVVCGPNGHWWVAAQAPVPSAFSAYFYALYHQSASKHPLIAPSHSSRSRAKTAIIVQLTEYGEGGRPKADRYMPEALRGRRTLLHEKHEDGPDLMLEPIDETRIDRLSTTLTRANLYPAPQRSSSTQGEEMELRHYLFNAWPDHGVPTGQAVQQLRELVMEIGRAREALGDCEVWVHCSAGVGRTGAFLALSSLLLPPRHPLFHQAESPLNPLPDELKGDRVAETIDLLREYRGLLVQTEEQMQLVYDLVRED